MTAARSAAHEAPGWDCSAPRAGAMFDVRCQEAATIERALGFSGLGNRIFEVKE